MDESSFCVLEKEDSFNLVAFLSYIALLLRDIEQTGVATDDELVQAQEVLLYWIGSFFKLPMNSEQRGEADAHMRECGITVKENIGGEIIIGRVSH